MVLPTPGWKKRSPSKTSEPLLFPIKNDPTMPPNSTYYQFDNFPAPFSWQT
jgi:hypothetical protein